MTRRRYDRRSAEKPLRIFDLQRSSSRLMSRAPASSTVEGKETSAKLLGNAERDEGRFPISAGSLGYDN